MQYEIKRKCERIVQMPAKVLKTAVFPIAGLGTRFLPATKSIPKELLPVLDTPLIQFAIDEARDAGIERMIFVNHPDKYAIETYVHQNPVLRRVLREQGKEALAETLDTLALGEEVQTQFIHQPERNGLGHAVLQARHFVEDDAFAVLLPDDLILGAPGCLSEMVEAYADTRGHLVAAMDVPRIETRKYGVLDPENGASGRLVQGRGMVEKPEPEVAPSTLAVVGRYVLDRSIFDDLAQQTPGAGGEIQLTDAIARGIDRVGLWGFRFSGTRFDCGQPAGMLKAAQYVAEQRGIA
jgi:UTP--glucose-1-phosphate uridylyltransferase